MCAAKTHPNSKTITTLRPNACILLFAFFKVHKVICKLNWILSSFTYLPNFIIWLPSFSSPWLVQLASKCHLAIFAFVRFLDFFHSVKKVFKPSIFCEIICVSKRTLVILISMLYCTAFFKTKKFVILFFLPFVWFISDKGTSLGVILPGGNFLGGKFLGVIFTGAVSIRGNIHRGEIFSLEEIFCGGLIVWETIFWWAIFLIPKLTIKKCRVYC